MTVNRFTRFAPSPTGFLHLGHAYSALFAAQQAKKSASQFILRIEDIDPVRCKPEFATAIFDDLAWLGLIWPQPVRFQSQHMEDYTAAMGRLKNMGVLYPCFCTRKKIAAEVAASGHAPHADDDEVIYPGTCRNFSDHERAEKLAQAKTANWRLDIRKSLAITGSLMWHDRGQGDITAQPDKFGDVVLARKDVPTSYHLSVTVDDHLQGITLVTRGKDLFQSTHIHRLLQALLGYHAPEYYHHDLMLDETGKRFAKRDKAVTLRSLREAGKTPEEIVARLAMSPKG